MAWAHTSIRTSAQCCTMDKNADYGPYRMEGVHRLNVERSSSDPPAGATKTASHSCWLRTSCLLPEAHTGCLIMAGQESSHETILVLLLATDDGRSGSHEPILVLLLAKQMMAHSREALGIWLIEDVDHDGVLVLGAHADEARQQVLIVVDPQGRVGDGRGVQRQVVVNEHVEAFIDHLLDGVQEAVVARVVGQVGVTGAGIAPEILRLRRDSPRINVSARRWVSFPPQPWRCASTAPEAPPLQMPA